MRGPRSLECAFLSLESQLQRTGAGSRPGLSAQRPRIEQRLLPIFVESPVIDSGLQREWAERFRHHFLQPTSVSLAAKKNLY